MIRKIERDEITRLLGSNHIQIIKDQLFKKKIFSRNGNHFSDRTISRILNGDENHKIEAAIIDLWEERLKELNEEENRKKRLLSESKSKQAV